MNQFANTETPRSTTLPGIGQSVESPKGLGRDGHKPLMRNRQATIAPSPIGITPGDTFSVIVLLLFLCGCGSIESAPPEPVTILWPTEKFTNNYASEYLWPQNMKWWAFEAGFGSDGHIYWRTNTEYDRIFGEFWDARDKAGLDR